MYINSITTLVNGEERGLVMIKCSLCKKMSVIAELDREELCMPCIIDLGEGLPEKDEDEDREGVGICLNCRKETILFRGLL